jgi:2-polyprenyl-6-methoxyphenol hydroxylase-like FAD-dependent oxidoreductase
LHELDLDLGGETRTIESRLVVGADGKNSRVRFWAKSSTSRDPVHHRIGGVLLADVGLRDDSAHVATFTGGRAFTLPLGGGQARAYIVTNGDCNQDVQRDRSGQAAIDLLASIYPEGAMHLARRTGPIAFFPNADQWAERIAGDGVVLIGDAAGANDPSVGHGLSLTFRDVRNLRDLLLDEANWEAAIREFDQRRQVYFETLRWSARWLGELVTEVGEAADARRERVERAREIDPSAGGFALIFARGPDGLVADGDARRRFFGEVD